MEKLSIIFAALALFVLTNTAILAQDKDNNEKPKTATVDAWRNALPSSEQPADTNTMQIVAEELKNSVETAETAPEIERKVLDLEKKLLDAIKRRDAVALNGLLAEDFVFAGVALTGEKRDKARFIEWTAKSFELKNYTVGKTVVRTNPGTAVVTYTYKRQASVGGTAADGDFVVSDVWIKRADQWQIIAHHVSELPKPEPNEKK